MVDGARPRVFITRQIHESGIRLLQEFCETIVWAQDRPPTQAELQRAAREADALLTLLTDTVDAYLLDACPNVRVVSNLAVGYDNIAVAAATERGVLIGNTPDALDETTADFTFALLMALARRVSEGAAYARDGHWTTWGPLLLLGADIHHATLGIVGLGRIGAAVARRARGFEMRILYTSHTRHEQMERDLGLEFTPLESLLAQADFVTLHTPLTPETRGLMNAERLRLMKPGAALINTARGPIVHTDALVAAAQEGRVSAALDVTDPEPLPPDHPLYTLPNVLITPHMASASVATRSSMARQAAHNILAALRGERLPHIVNAEAYGHGRCAQPPRLPHGSTFS